MSGEAAGPALPAPFRDCSAILACPATGETLVAGEREFIAPQRRYPVLEGIPRLFVPVDAAGRSPAAAAVWPDTSLRCDDCGIRDPSRRAR